MSKSRFLVMAGGIFVLSVFAFAFSIIGFDVGMTGRAIFGDSNYSDFDGGNYYDTEWNGSAVVLSGNNLSGSFESRIFNSGIEAGANLNNLSAVYSAPSAYVLYVVDNQAGVWSSSDGGVSWDSVNPDYNGGDFNAASDMTSDDNYLYIVNNQDIWRSDDFGETWSKVSDDFNGGSSSASAKFITWDGSSLFVVDGAEDVYVSDDFGVSWVQVAANFNGGNGNSFGLVGDSSGDLWMVDGQAYFWSSDDEGVTWNIVNSDYNDGDGNDPLSLFVDDNDYFYIVEGDKNIWRSVDFGVSWVKVNDHYSGEPNDPKVSSYLDGALFIVEGDEEVWSSIDDGFSWTKVSFDLNGGNGDVAGIATRVLSSSVSFEVMNCSTDDCWDGVWQSVDLGSINLQERYFRYKAYFVSPIVGVVPSLSEVLLDYDLLNSVPVIDLVSPESLLYVDNNSLELNYSVFDEDGNIDSCWYEIDSSGVVILPGCLNVTFGVNEGVHNLSVYVNDSFGEESRDSVSFNVDVSGVSVVLSEPLGAKTSRLGILLSYSVIGANFCWYNVETSIGGSVIENTSLVNCSGSFFNVSADGDYVLNLFANNSLGSFDYDSSAFSVDTSIPPVVDDGGSSGGGGGGGGGGAAVSSSSNGNFDIEEINVIASIGEEKSLVVSVKNSGRVAANKCSLVGGSYVDSEDIMNIGVGELIEFMFVLSVTDFGVEDFNLSLVCLDNVSADVPLKVTVLRPELDVSIGGISFDDEGRLLVEYSVDSVQSGLSVLVFRVFDSKGGIVADVEEEVEFVSGEVYSGEVSVDISEAEKGMLKVAISGEDRVSFVEEDFVYGGGAGITGNALLGVENRGGLIWVIGGLFVGLIGFVAWRGRKLIDNK